MNPKTVKPESIAAQALGWIDDKTRAITPPIHVSSTYLRDPDNQYRSGRSTPAPTTRPSTRPRR
jgi:cystathionine gamma-synthase